MRANTDRDRHVQANTDKYKKLQAGTDEHKKAHESTDRYIHCTGRRGTPQQSLVCTELKLEHVIRHYGRGPRWGEVVGRGWCVVGAYHIYISFSVNSSQAEVQRRFYMYGPCE